MNTRVVRFFGLFFCLLALLVACSPRLSTERLLDAAISGEHRADGHALRDAYRNPKETLLFFGLMPDMRVLELWPGGAGWYTEILAPVLRDRGKLIVLTPSVEGSGRFANYLRKAYKSLMDKFAAHPDTYDQVEVVAVPPRNWGNAVEPGSLDMVLSFRNVHNWMSGSYAEQSFASIFDALKPCGMLGVTDHRIPHSQVIDDRATTGYVSERQLRKLALDAGFEFVKRSEINANPKDNGDHPDGVWSLPPTLRGDAADHKRFKAIGESDRMTLLFARPGSDCAR